jgi:hypothetical protein
MGCEGRRVPEGEVNNPFASSNPFALNNQPVHPELVEGPCDEGFDRFSPNGSTPFTLSLSKGPCDEGLDGLSPNGLGGSAQSS